MGGEAREGTTKMLGEKITSEATAQHRAKNKQRSWTEQRKRMYKSQSDLCTPYDERMRATARSVQSTSSNTGPLASCSSGRGD